MTEIKVACVQYAYKPINNFKEFESNVENLLNQAPGAKFVVFPEVFTMELQYITPNKSIGEIHEFTDQYIELFSRLSKKKNQYIIAGSHLTKRNEKEYNIAYLFCPDGNRLEHVKTHLFPLEGKLGVTPGDKLEIFEIEGIKIGIATCYEQEIPEVARTLTLKGAEIIFTPSNTIDEYGFWRVRHCCQARAIENQIYVLHSCLVGHMNLDIEMSGWGRSSILSPCEPPWPKNGIIAEAKTNEEMVITGVLDLKLLHKKRKRGVATTLKDRRPEIFEL